MNEGHRYIKARLKTLERLVMVYPDAESWGKPFETGCLFRSADEVILPYLGKTVWLKKKLLDLCGFLFEIKDTNGWVVMPDWVEYFDSQDLVPPANWDDPYCERFDDIWLEPFEERWTIIMDLFIVTG